MNLSLAPRVVSATLAFLAVHTVALAQQEAYVKASNTDAGDGFATSVSVFGDTLVVGAPGEASSATGVNGDQSDDSLAAPGAAYVYVRNGTTWTQQAYLKASNTGAGDEFGSAVAIWGDTLVVGAENEDLSGAVYVFVRSGTTWSQQAYLKASNPGVSDQFGGAVALYGDTLVVGSAAEDSSSTGVGGNESLENASNAGAAYVFVRSGTAWSQQAYLKASNSEANDGFGGSVTVFGNTIVVGAVGESSDATGIDGNQASNSASNAGAAYVFTRSGSTWSQQAYVKASNTGSPDAFGKCVALFGDTLAVGAHREASQATGVNGNQASNSMFGSGAVYVFTRTGSAWTQEAYLKASNTGGNDSFGTFVGISGSLLVVGARLEDSNATGVNGDGTNNGAPDAGAAYVFAHTGGGWSPTAYLKASNCEAGDDFGSCVTVAGDTVVVGAAFEDSSTIGINQNQSDNNNLHAGAAYAFRIEVPPTDFCFGDGSGTACPCGNNGASGRGCANSIDSTGANLAWSGIASLASDTVSLAGSGVPNGPGLYFQGTTQLGGGAGIVFGDGLRCVGGSVIRLGVVLASSNASSYPTPVAPNNVPVSVKGACAAGNIRTYQLWYRDSASFCSPSVFNLTNALSLTWAP